jgi:hypothetical protein
MVMGEVLVSWKNGELRTTSRNCWCDRGGSMERLVSQAFSIMSDKEKTNLSPFDALLKVDDHGDGEYTICSDRYTERTLPCYIFDHWKEAKIDDYSEMCERIKERAKNPYKFDKLFWAGQISHPTRRTFIENFSSHPKMEIVYHRDHWGHSSTLPQRYLSLPDHCDYKYMLDLQGNGYSGRTKLLLHTKRVLFYQARRLHEYWFWDMEPFTHYIPVAEDLSDMKEKFEWAEDHPHECQKIAENAYQFALSNLKRSDAVKRIKDILVKIGEKKMKSTITLCVLACAKNDKYKKRLMDFIGSYGFKNSDPEHKAKIVFLVEEEDRPDFVDESFGWHKCPGLPLSMRFMKYLSEESLESDWVMQVDDDSSTDIDKTIELLDQYYDPRDSMMLMGGRNTDLEMGLQNIIRMMKVPNFLFSSGDISKFDTTPYFIHAWEPSIISNVAVERIKNWDGLREFMELCKVRRPIFGDQVPYVAARLAKVPIVECLFLSPFCKNQDYSAINPQGRFSHIHYITEKWGEYEQFKKNMLESKSNIPISKDPNAGEFWEFYAEEKGGRRNIGTLRLDSDGKIGVYNNFNERFWRAEGDSIIIMDENRSVTCTMSKVSDNKYSGPFKKNKNVIHCIEKLK